MKETIRILNSNDSNLLETMDTGKTEDYVKRIFDRLTKGPNRLYGLFVDNQLVSLGGYTVYANRYAMLGRLRSDKRYRGKNYATKLMKFVMNEAFLQEGIQWVGANTQKDNIPARRVLNKMNFASYITLHGAVTKDTTILETGAKTWNKIHDLQEKLIWIDKIYIQNKAIFPYECYYPFPASTDLFSSEVLNNWNFYHNRTNDRVLITKTDRKKHEYLHAVYPWNDFTEQKGLWETISQDYIKLLQQTDNEAYIWIDLTKEEADKLPKGHSFELPSPWILYGMERKTWEKANTNKESITTL